MAVVNVDPRAVEKTASLDNIKEAYQRKIDAYHSLLRSLQADRDRLIKQVEAGSITVTEFMRKAEKNGIDDMNHRTIIEMLSRQHMEWFGEKPHGEAVPEGLEKFLSKPDIIL